MSQMCVPTLGLLSYQRLSWFCSFHSSVSIVDSNIATQSLALHKSYPLQDHRLEQEHINLIY